MYMEDVNKLSVDIVESVDTILKSNNLTMTTDMENAIFDKILEVIEELAGYPDYRNYN
jgi:hypothetical protein